jgi:hypothetical protein
MNATVKALLLAVTTFFAATASGSAKDCEAQLHHSVKVTVLDDVLVAIGDDGSKIEFALPVVGSFWRCIEMAAFPDQDLVIVEWHEGSAGTSKIFSRTSLLAFSINTTGVVPKGVWVLVESLQGASGTEFSVNRTYGIEEDDGRVDIIFTGIQRVTVNAS